MTAPRLPTPFTARPPTLADLDDVVAVMRANEHEMTGEALTSLTDVRSDWARPSFDLATDALLVEDDGRAVGYAEQSAGRAWVAVHPDARGRGIGTALLAWTEAHTIRQGLPRVGQTVPDAAVAAVALLDEHGYAPRWQTWVFSIPLTDPPPEPTLPDGMTIRPMVRPDEDAAVHDVVETAFSDWPDRDGGMPFEDYRAAHLDRDDVEVLVLTDGAALLGAAVCIEEGDGEGWVEQLAMTRAHRGRGLGQALLRTAFQRFAEHGCTTAGLTTDSRTGARALYEHVGMTVSSSWTRWSKDLTI
jgi:mycothiol synthase